MMDYLTVEQLNADAQPYMAPFYAHQCRLWLFIAKTRLRHGAIVDALNAYSISATYAELAMRMQGARYG
ncbi:hypothetical protein [Shewanella marina]|uniref:hypothetical protein n=1 Tax=Shewanella marina TaxID=487319 RepID=UPI0004705DD2|nr:hypothetical protein [Shewanella marina]